jgi:hypothetical protein
MPTIEIVDSFMSYRARATVTSRSVPLRPSSSMALLVVEAVMLAAVAVGVTQLLSESDDPAGRERQ